MIPGAEQKSPGGRRSFGGGWGERCKENHEKKIGRKGEGSRSWLRRDFVCGAHGVREAREKEAIAVPGEIRSWTLGLAEGGGRMHWRRDT